jgi:phage gp36-like protein
MPYADLSALVARSSEQLLIQLTDDKGQKVVDNQVINEALDGADDAVNRHLRSRYQLPLGSVPPGIRDIAAWLALYQLYSRRLNLAVPQSIQDKYDQSIKELEKLATWKTTLDVLASTTGESGPGPILTNTDRQTREFSRDTLRRFR